MLLGHLDHPIHMDPASLKGFSHGPERSEMSYPVSNYLVAKEIHSDSMGFFVLFLFFVLCSPPPHIMLLKSLVNHQLTDINMIGGGGGVGLDQT